ncbi:MAG: hypothetical protein QOI26_1090 [Pseudonocardiales bacterium]|jgi:hypothetical protein|nr:hypothetical protein [Pseudonocardiales bacterium]
MLVLASIGHLPAAAAFGPGCGASGGSFHGAGDDGSVGVTGACGVTPTDLPGNGGSPVLVIDCGYATATDDHTHWNPSCGPTGFPCPPVPGTANPHQFITVVSLADTAVPIAAWCAGANTPMPSAAALRDEVIRLLHPPALGVSPSTGTALINLRTLFWVDTATEVDLGRASLIGFPVSLRVVYDRTEFDFGDGSGGTLAANPGLAYDPAQDCGACTDRFGHNYSQRGTVTVTARVYWHAQFRIGTSAWTDIPGEVTANQPSQTTLTVKQSRGTLTAPR